jgi:hypothetical protein
MTLSLCLALPGCAASPRRGDARDYPLAQPQVRVENVQVIRRETSIVLNNTTARPFRPGTIWVNRQFSRPINGLEIGESISLPLAEFRNEHGEPFRAGGFFATERPEAVVQVQFEEDNEMLGLVVVDER